MKITVSDVRDALANGLTHAGVLEEYPYLVEKDVLAGLAFAAGRESKRVARVA